MFNYYIMKLVRLSTNNNGYFRSSFGNDMIIAPQSKMALLNLTFQSAELGTFAVVTDGMSIVTITDLDDVVNTTGVSVLLARDFDVNESEEYIEYLLHALNSTLRIGYDQDLLNCSGSNYGIVSNSGFGSLTGNVEIVFRYCPFVNPLNYSKFAGMLNAKIMEYDAQVLDINYTSSVPPPRGLTTIQKDASQLAAVDTKANLVTNVKLSTGSGFLSVRIADSVDNGSGLQDNGFGIGLSFKSMSSQNIDVGDELPATQRNFEIRYNRALENYTYIDDGGTEKTSTVVPNKVAIIGHPNVETHDIMGFEIQGGQLKLMVYQDLAAPNNRHVLATINLDHPTTGGRGDLGLYPYMYVRGGSSDIKLDMFNWTPSTVQRLDTNQSWGPGTSPPGNEDGFWGVLDGSGMTNAYNDMKEFAGVSATIAAATPNLYYQADGGNTRWFQDFTAKILIETALLKPLGFSNLVSNSDGQTVFDKTISEDARPGGLGPWEFTIRGDELPEFYTSDNFLIESMTLPLDSYDASRVDYSSNVLYSKETEKRGRRKNILQTIPVNDNTTGLVEYQTNTPIFIDINNKEKMNVKNLDFRILRKDFSTIEQNNEEAILTVLISE